ncbi:3-deoxy-manno-octulosonate cytidylyltransferase [Pseudomonas sp. S60]|nr:3-deoxy-manno-octulosonate cytidylyltransferase [Pseudomonas sp. S60]
MNIYEHALQRGAGEGWRHIGVIAAQRSVLHHFEAYLVLTE